MIRLRKKHIAYIFMGCRTGSQETLVLCLSLPLTYVIYLLCDSASHPHFLCLCFSVCKVEIVETIHLRSALSSVNLKALQA